MAHEPAGIELDNVGITMEGPLLVNRSGKIGSSSEGFPTSVYSIKRRKGEETTLSASEFEKQRLEALKSKDADVRAAAAAYGAPAFENGVRVRSLKILLRAQLWIIDMT